MSDQGQAYLTFIEGELKSERERRATIDGRGQALVATSGALVTLLSGIAALVLIGNKLHPPSLAVAILILATALFVLSALAGIVAGWNSYYDVADVSTLTHMFNDHWTDDDIIARNHVAVLQTKSIRTLRNGNKFKAVCISIGLVCQMLAVVAFAVAVVVMIGQVS